MSVEPFEYSDEQWRRLEAIVLRAGGDNAKENFAKRRDQIQKQGAVWKKRLNAWDGLTFGHDRTKDYERMARAASDLAKALDTRPIGRDERGEPFSYALLLPAILWEPPSDAEISDENTFAKYCAANETRVSKFVEDLNRAGAYAKVLANKKRRRAANLQRDAFFLMLMRIWHDLGLRIGGNAESSLVCEFIQCASVGVLDHVTGMSAVANVVRHWKREIENGAV